MNPDKLKEVFANQKTPQKQEEAPQEELQVIGFKLGEEEFGIPILNILEIVKPIEYTRIPRTPDYVLGVFNLRGNVFPLIDLRLKFKMPAKKMDKHTCYIIINHEDKIAGFVIDHLSQAMRFQPSEIDDIPDGINEQEDLMQGVGKKEDSIITILKVENLLRKTF